MLTGNYYSVGDWGAVMSGSRKPKKGLPVGCTGVMEKREGRLLLVLL